jgi:hypothetical protein
MRPWNWENCQEKMLCAECAQTSFFTMGIRYFMVQVLQVLWENTLAPAYGALLNSHLNIS